MAEYLEKFRSFAKAGRSDPEFARSPSIDLDEWGLSKKLKVKNKKLENDEEEMLAKQQVAPENICVRAPNAKIDEYYESLLHGSRWIYGLFAVTTHILQYEKIPIHFTRRKSYYSVRRRTGYFQRQPDAMVA